MANEVAPTRKCFVLSRIGEDGSPERAAADTVLKHLIKKAIGSDFVVLRADDDTNPGAITPRIVASILEADLVVADLTGLNANVFYELAIAHGYNKPTVHIQTADERAPFDIKDMRIVRYNTADPDELEAAQKKLHDYAAHATARPDEIETPLSSAQKFIAVQASEDPVAESNVQVMDAIRDLRTDIKRLSPRRTAPPTTQTRIRLDQADANQRSLRMIVDRVVAARRAKREDFTAVITESTSEGFDKWAREKLAETSDKKIDDPTEGAILFDKGMFEIETGEDETEDDAEPR